MKEYRIHWNDLTEKAQNEILEIMGVTRDAIEYDSDDFYIASVFVPQTDNLSNTIF